MLRIFIRIQFKILQKTYFCNVINQDYENGITQVSDYFSSSFLNLLYSGKRAAGDGCTLEGIAELY